MISQKLVRIVNDTFNLQQTSSSSGFPFFEIDYIRKDLPSVLNRFNTWLKSSNKEVPMSSLFVYSTLKEIDTFTKDPLSLSEHSIHVTAQIALHGLTTDAPNCLEKALNILCRLLHVSCDLLVSGLIVSKCTEEFARLIERQHFCSTKQTVQMISSFVRHSGTLFAASSSKASRRKILELMFQACDIDFTFSEHLSSIFAIPTELSCQKSDDTIFQSRSF
jgi:hypothetical protein